MVFQGWLANDFRAVSAGVVFMMIAARGLAQAPSNDPVFEVASVKAVDNERTRPLPPFLALRLAVQGGPGTSNPARIRYSGVTMRMLMRQAYSLKSDQIAGSGWIDEQHYEIIANVPLGTNKEHLQLMLRSLLMERFQMEVHREKKEMSIYVLLVTKGGPKLESAELQKQVATRLAAPGPGSPGQRSFHLANSSVDGFIDNISADVERPVFDRTGLKGNFAFTLSYSRGAPTPQAAASDVAPGLSVFDAVKTQLGLELQPRKEEVDMLFIDRASRLPTGN